MTKTLKKTMFLIIVTVMALTASMPTVYAATKTKNIKLASKTKTAAITVIQGDKIKITTYNGSNKLSVSTPKYKSNRKSIASVSSKGVVTAKKAGKAVITVTYKKRTAKLAVTVKKKVNPTKITINKTKLTMYVGDKATLKATIKPANATNKKITWASSNKAVVQVSSKGLVYAKKAGTAIITATTANKKKVACTITVKTKTVNAASVTLNKKSVSMTTGASTTLTTTVAPANTTNKTITWTSSNTGIASVTSNGKVTAKKAGKAVITAKTANNKTATCTITVSEPIIEASSVSLSQTVIELKETEMYELFANIYPVNATNKNVKWASSDTSIATISDGKVTAKNAGTATITVTTENGKKATCTVTIHKTETPTVPETPSSGGQEAPGNIITVNGIQFDVSEAPTTMNIFGGNDKNSVLMGVLQSDKFYITPLANISEKDVTWKINNGAVQTVITNYYDVGAEMNNTVSVPNTKTAVAYVEYGKSKNTGKYSARVIPACKTGTFTIAMYFKGSLVRQTKVIVHSADYREIELRRIVSAINKQLPANPSADDLAVTTAAYVYENFSYDYPPAGDGMDCTQGADILGMVFQSHGYRVMFHSTDDNVKSYYVHPVITTLGHVDAYALDNNGNILTGRPVQGHFLKDWNN